MDFASIRLRVLAFGLVGLLAALVLAEVATPATAACRQQLITDWSDNGRVDRVYPLDCYHEAIEAMAPDIRDYTDAQESIELALALAIRKKTDSKPAAPRSLAAAAAVETDGSAPLPLPLLAIGAVGAAGLLAGGLTFAGRRALLGRKGGAR
jgi:hypothetical protein